MKINPLNSKKIIEEIYKNKKIDAYLVGGCVRDWYLGKKCFDIDITFEDYPIEIAKYISKKFEFKINEFKNFLTIRLISKKQRIDFATFRKERYKKAGALPVVSITKKIEDDLKRRDFTINSIAISINKDLYEVKDPYNGIKDIDKKLIRVLHNKSFVDDPTRIFRAIRFAKRFGFDIEKNTLNLLKNSIDYIKVISKERIRNEIIKILYEKNSYEMIDSLKKFGADSFIPFNIDEKINKYKKLIDKLTYIAKYNKSMDFLYNLNFERKVKNEVRSKLSKI